MDCKCSVLVIFPCSQSRDDICLSSLSYSKLLVCCDGKEVLVMISLEVMMVLQAELVL